MADSSIEYFEDLTVIEGNEITKDQNNIYVNRPNEAAAADKDSIITIEKLTHFINSDNAYWDGTNWRYIAAGVSTISLQDSGEHIFYNMPSGSADDIITLSSNETLKINNLGNIGTKNSSLENWIGWTALQISGNTTLMATTGSGAGQWAGFIQNGYTDGAWKYQDTDEASVMFMVNGEIIFQVAPSGTADTAISWLEALRISNIGHIGIKNSNLDNWESIRSIIQVGGNANISGDAAGGVGKYFELTQNAYADGVSWKYQDTDEASMYRQTSGIHSLWVAASGTADTSITWTEALTIANSGNVGIRNPNIENWGTSKAAIQIGANANILGDIASGAGKDLSITQNAYLDPGAWKYQDTDEASMYLQFSGTHIFQVAVSGTADTSISWIQVLQINNDGNVSIKNSSLESWNSSQTALQIGGNFSLLGDTTSGANKAAWMLQNAYFDAVGFKYQDTALASAYSQSLGTHDFYTVASGTADTAITWTRVFRIDTNGKLATGGEITPLCGNNGLHIRTSDTGIAYSSSTYDNLIIEENGNCGLTLLCNSGGSAGIAFADEATIRGAIAYVHASDLMQFTVNANVRFKIESDGGIFMDNLLGTTGGSDVRYNTGTKELFYDTSAKKYKENIRDEADTTWIMDVKVKTYDRKNSDKKDEVGIIADDIREIKPEFVCYNEHGEIESYSKSDLVPLLLNELQKLKEEVELLKERV
jgi:hypothetical protein